MKILSCTANGNVILEATYDELDVLRGYADTHGEAVIQRRPSSSVGDVFRIPNRLQALRQLLRHLRPITDMLYNGLELLQVERPAEFERYLLAESNAEHVQARAREKNAKRAAAVNRAWAKALLARKAYEKMIGGKDPMGTEAVAPAETKRT